MGAPGHAHRVRFGRTLPKFGRTHPNNDVKWSALAEIGPKRPKSANTGPNWADSAQTWPNAKADDSGVISSLCQRVHPCRPCRDSMYQPITIPSTVSTNLAMFGKAVESPALTLRTARIGRCESMCCCCRICPEVARFGANLAESRPISVERLPNLARIGPNLAETREPPRGKCSRLLGLCAAQAPPRLGTLLDTRPRLAPTERPSQYVAHAARHTDLVHARPDPALSGHPQRTRCDTPRNRSPPPGSPSTDLVDSPHAGLPWRDGGTGIWSASIRIKSLKVEPTQLARGWKSTKPTYELKVDTRVMNAPPHRGTRGNLALSIHNTTPLATTSTGAPGSRRVSAQSTPQATTSASSQPPGGSPSVVISSRVLSRFSSTSRGSFTIQGRLEVHRAR